MKPQRFFVLMLALLLALSAMASSPLRSTRLFDGHYRSNPNASETIVTGKSLKQYDLDIYQGLTITDAPAEADVIEKCVSYDSRTAVDREVSYRDGRLYYVFLAMPPEGNRNRYVFYLNQHLAGGNKIILIYMSGKADSDKIKSIIKK